MYDELNSANRLRVPPLDGPVTEPALRCSQPPLITQIESTNADSISTDCIHAGPIDPADLGRLLNQHAAGLTLYARQWSAAGEDIVQEAFIELARQPHAPQSVAAWLYRVVRNRAIAAARSEGRRRRHEQTASQQINPWFVVDSASKLDGEQAAAVLSQLPIDEREVIVAHVWGQLTFAEVAELTGLPSSTAHRRYESGLKKLKAQLGN